MQQYNKVFPEELKSIGFQLSWGNTHKRNKAQDVSSVHEFPSHTVDLLATPEASQPIIILKSS